MLKTLRTLNTKEIPMSRTKVKNKYINWLLKNGNEKEIAHTQFVIAKEKTSKTIDKSFKGMKSVVARRFK